MVEEEIQEMNFFKMICENCKKRIEKKPIKEAVKSREWWRNELRNFGWGNFLIFIAILLIFSGFYFEYGEKVKNPCEWCKIRISGQTEEETISCAEISEIAKEQPLIVNQLKLWENGTIENFYLEKDK